MKFLIDSHVFVWLVFAPDQIGLGARAEITSAERVALSVVSLWELALKHAKGRFPHSAEEITQAVAALGAEELAIEHRHLLALGDIDLPQGDPFDTLLTAQAQADDLVLLTADRQLLGSPYPTFDVRR